MKTRYAKTVIHYITVGKHDTNMWVKVILVTRHRANYYVLQLCHDSHKYFNEESMRIAEIIDNMI